MTSAPSTPQCRSRTTSACSSGRASGRRIPIIKRLTDTPEVAQWVKPGITGWAQVNGHRGETDTVEKMRARVEYDLQYLRNWSLGLDLKIIVATIRVLFFDRQAY